MLKIPAEDAAALAPNETAARLLLSTTGDDPEREGLRRTPERFAKAMSDLTSGYSKTAADVIGQGIFASEGEGLVSVKNIEFYSLCEHHLLPFWGKASLAYYPGPQILGLSKIPRLVDLFARRLQVQERLTRQVAEAVKDAIRPRAVVARLEACHLCMMMRGVEKQSSSTITEHATGLETLSSTEKERLWSSL
jgi:GTP cyclohydrolase I